MSPPPPHQNSSLNCQTHHPSLSSQIKQPSSFCRLTTILGSSLETILHQLLYLHSSILYPRDAFSATRYLGVSCKACRHPDVVDYIYDFLKVAVPALCFGIADEFLFVILSTSSNDNNDDLDGARRSSGIVKDVVLLRYSFQISMFDISNPTLNNGVPSEEEEEARARKQNNTEGEEEIDLDKILLAKRKRDLERGMRDVLLKVISMEGNIHETVSSHCLKGRRNTKNRNCNQGMDNVTFKLCLHTAKDTTKHNNNNNNNIEKCHELHQAIMEGKWFASPNNEEEESCQFPTHNNIDESEDDEGVLNNKHDNDGTKKNRSMLKIAPQGFIRPLKSVHVPSCGLKCQLLMEVAN